MSISTRKQSIAACILCCHEIDNVTRFDTVGACGHKGCCSRCALRMRQLLGTTSCVICKTDLARVICVEHESDRFDSFQDWGDNIGPTHVFDEPSGMFFLKRDYANLHLLRDPVCRKCSKSFSTLAGLKTHLLDAHQLQFCSICLEHKKVFLQELDLWTKEQLKRHNAKGTPKEGFSGHPRCDFCFSRYYSTAELYDHLHKNHFECDICLHSMHIQNRYYKNYHDLENHFRAEHYLCEEPVCLMKKFVVFKAHLDLQAHVATEHPHIKTSRKIDVHFTVRRAVHDDAAGADYDASAFQSAGSNSDRNIINVADFPSLSSDPSAAAGTSSFWESQASTRPRIEDFPELGGGSRSGANANAGSSFRNALAPPPTPAMRAHMRNGGNNDQWEYPELATAAAALGANNPLMRFVKPSKMKTKRGKKASGNGGNGTGSPSDLEEKAPATTGSADGSGDDDEEKADSTIGEQSKSAIVLKLRQVLGSDAKYEIFREDCKAFRLADVDIATFYAKMKSQFSANDFEQLFLRLMRLFPDREQVDLFFAYHRDVTKQQRQSQHGFQNKKQNKTKQTKQTKQQATVPGATQRRSQTQQQPSQPSTSGWANALRETGAAAQPIGRNGPAVVIHNTNTRAILGRDEPPKTTWRSSQTWQAPVAPVASQFAIASSQTPTTTKIQTAPVESFASLAVSASPVTSSSSSYASASVPQGSNASVPTLKSRDEFPGLPAAGRVVGVQAVTRATWDDQVQAIAQNHGGVASAAAATSTADTKGSGKKKQKKKAMTLGEMAMKFT